MNKNTKIVTLLGWIFTAAALVYLIYRLYKYDNYEAFWHSFALADSGQYMALGLAILLLPCQLLIESRKWQVMLLGMVPVSLREAFWQVIYGHVAAFITPYRLGEYPGRLIRMGYTVEQWREFVGTWRDWLEDWRKWLRVLLLHLARYIVWMEQLWAILYFCGVELSPAEAFAAIVSYYFCITVMPSVPAADVAFKGGWAVLIFSHFTDNIPAIAVAVTLVWCINTVLPLLLSFFMVRKKDMESGEE